MVKFLANFDHPSGRRACSSQNVDACTRSKTPYFKAFQTLSKIKNALADGGTSHNFAHSPPENFLAPPYGCAIVPRILGNWILNEMDNHGT
jgi:hypothetical protein